MVCKSVAMQGCQWAKPYHILSLHILPDMNCAGTPFSNKREKGCYWLLFRGLTFANKMSHTDKSKVPDCYTRSHAIALQ